MNDQRGAPEVGERCGSAGCGCGAASVARVNGVALHAPGEALSAEDLRQRACTELLRQQAKAQGLLDADDPPGTQGATSEAASAAIERLLDLELDVPEASQQACRRHFEAHRATYSSGARVRARHVLFAVTPGVDVNALRARAEALLVELRCANDEGRSFDAAARQWSNCPSGRAGGELGWLAPSDCAPEFARELFATGTGPEQVAHVGVLPRLVNSRFGFHVVEVLARDGGQVPAFEQVRPAVAQALRQQAWVTALRRYLQQLADAARLEGVELGAADAPAAT